MSTVPSFEKPEYSVRLATVEMSFVDNGYVVDVKLEFLFLNYTESCVMRTEVYQLM